MKQLLENDILEIQNFIEKFNFATIVSSVNNIPAITHLPVLVDRQQGLYGTLIWHMSVRNSHADQLEGVENTKCIIQGPHSYISPAWYKSSPNVPTWNYAIVHLSGVPKKVSREQLVADLSRIVEYHEKKVNSNYIIPNDYKLKLMEHIVGFRMEITDIQSKFKLGLTRSLDDQKGILTNLQNIDRHESQAYVDFIKTLLA